MKVCQQCGAQYDSTQSFCPVDGEVLQDNHAEMIGRVLDGQYQIEEFIAEGGMGAVYKARHTLLGDKVAIKLLPPEMRRNAAWLKRFQREGQAARRFHHPNSVIVHDLRTSSEGEIYLVMEFVEGRTLDAEVGARGGRLSLAEALQIIEPIASVLDAAHATGVVHRDLKPSNIMITNRGIVKLLDLGVAKVSDPGAGATSLTMTGQLLGTPYFMSPEQWGESQRDGSEEIDGRTDIYSLGVVVYQLTTSEFPFKGTSVVTLRHAHCQEAPRLLEEFDASIPADWSRAVLRAMSKDRSDRQATAGEFARELRAALGDTNAREAYTLKAAPTLPVPPRETSAAMRLTPQNLNAPTINTNEGTQNSQQTAPFSAPPDYQSAQFQAPPRTAARSTLILIAIAAFLILGAGGFALWKWRSGSRAAEKRAARQTKSSANEANNEASDTSTSANTGSASTVGDESTVSEGDAFIRYNLLLSPTLLDNALPASGRDPIKTGQIVQFDFRFRESGYLYIFGHDNAGNLMMMPIGDVNGMENIEASVKATAGAETVFPSLPLIKLDSPSGTEDFLVIFSESPLALPFVNTTLPLDGSFRKLTADEQRQVDELRKQAVPATTQFDGDTVVVKPESGHGSKPVVFDIKLKLQRS